MRNMNIIPDTDVVRYIHQESGRYAAFLGAGVSAEAAVPTAGQIAEDVLDRLHAADPEGDVATLKRELKWDDPRRRYSTCLLKYGNDAQRVEYFRRLLRGIRPSFGHHATALLMRRGVLKRTCITTNFDKLLEIAFAQQGDECQPIRMKEETQFWRVADPDRYYTVKLHGDYDTHNILNTRDETLRIDADLKGIVHGLLGDGGVVVLGTGGFEESVVQLFNELVMPELASRTSDKTELASRTSGVPLGLFWGIYVGAARPDRVTAAESTEAVRRAIQSGCVSDEILEMMSRADTPRRPCAFFPVWGAGAFLFRVIRASSDKVLIGSSELYLDHEMRLRNVFTKAGLSTDAINRHLARLAEQRKRVTGLSPARATETVCVARRDAPGTELRVLYGDITSRALMASEDGRRAVLSAEDTCVSAGGGVAYSLLVKAGPQTILNELAKLAPIPQGEIAVTSGGALPVSYIFHAAALRIEQDASYAVTMDDVSRAVSAALRCAAALDVRAILVPLIAAGVGPLTPAQSFEAIVRALVTRGSEPASLRMSIVIFKESELPRTDIVSRLQRILPADFVLQSTAELV